MGRTLLDALCSCSLGRSLRAPLVLLGAVLGFADGQRGLSGAEPRPHLDPAQAQNVPASVGRKFIQLPSDLHGVWKQRAVTRPVEVSAR